MATVNAAKLRIFLTGRFRVEGESGLDVTPQSAKAQGLLALVATDSRMTRGRAWLQDKLWSESEAEKGAGSLRQALVHIRRSFGADAGVLASDRQIVRLDPTRIELDRTTPGEFMEGIDIRDPEFEAWLSLMRSAGAGSLGVPEARLISRALPETRRPMRELVIETVNDPTSRLGVVETQFGDAVCRSLHEMFLVKAKRSRPGSVRPGTLALGIHAFDAGGGRLGLRIAVHDGAGEGSPWAESTVGPQPDSRVGFGLDHLNLSHRVTVALVDLLARPVTDNLHDADANFLAGTALRKMFSMRRGTLDEADQLFMDAYVLEPRGLFLAWRAQLAVIRFVESGGADRKDSVALAEELCANAMEREPTNSNVLAAVANARLVLEGDGQASRELSRLGVQANPANPLAWWSWANGLLYTGEAEKAHAAAKTAQLLARSGTFRFWTDFQVALTAAATGRTDEAIANAEVSRALCPSFRPPLRYLVGILSSAGRADEARVALGRLRRIEPEFSIDRMIGDPSYPVSMMRKAGFVDPARLRDL